MDIERMNHSQHSGSCQRPPAGRNGRRKAAEVLAGFCFLLAALVTQAAPAVTAHQVKAIFLFNFAKYVEWPAESFATATAPIIIGVLRDDNFKTALERAVEGKSVNGRTIIVKQVITDSEIKSCHILFISTAENSRLEGTLDVTKTLPILTVGENEQFMVKGGIINFTMKEGNVRLEIELSTAHQSKLQISSKLLSAADVVKGRAK